MLKISHSGLAIAIFFCTLPVHAQSTATKCTDGKVITYANMPCEELGLKSAGKIKNAVTVVPAIRAPQKSPPKNPDIKRSEPAEDTETDTAGAGKIKPINPLLEKLLQ